MRIVKITHENQFAQIANSTLRDWRLSFKARGILAVIISLPADWEITVEWLAKQGEQDGRDSVRAGMAELEKFCYARYVKDRAEGGKLAGGHWEVREDTSLTWPSPTTDFPKSVKPKPAEPKPENPTLQIQADKNPQGLGEFLGIDETTKNKARGSLEEVKAFCKSHNIPESDAEAVFLRWNGNGWKNGNSAIKCWRSVILSHQRSNYLPSQRHGQNNGRFGRNQAAGGRNSGTVNDASDYGS